jgi:hypothetical protein
MIRRQAHVQIKHYHCDNGCFADTLFCAACNSQTQMLTFCGVINKLINKLS